MNAKLRIATFLAPNMLPVYEFLVDAIGRELGSSAELVLGASFDQFGNGEIDAGFICGLPYVQLTRQVPAPVELLAAPVLRGDRYAGRPIYFSDVIVRRDSPVRTFADLRGRSWAYNDSDSHSGYNLTRHHLVKMGETHGFFARVIEAGYHQQRDTDGRGGRGRRRRDRFAGAGDRASRPLASSRRAPSDRWLSDPRRFNRWSRHGISRSMSKPRCARSCCAWATDRSARNELERGFIDRFVPVTDADYDDIREMLRVRGARRIPHARIARCGDWTIAARWFLEHLVIACAGHCPTRRANSVIRILGGVCLILFSAYRFSPHDRSQLQRLARARPVRAEPDRAAAHRRRPHRALQLAAGARASPA